MKNQTEILEALLAGEILKHETDEDTFYVKFVDNVLYYSFNSDFNPSSKYTEIFMDPDKWEIFKVPKWYEKDLSDGVLCRVKFQIDVKNWDIALIDGYEPGDRNKFTCSAYSRTYYLAEPLDLTKPFKPQLI